MRLPGFHGVVIHGAVIHGGSRYHEGSIHRRFSVWAWSRRAAVYPPDTGCRYAPRCTVGPRVTCNKELPADERGAFTAALGIVLSYAAAE